MGEKEKSRIRDEYSFAFADTGGQTAGRWAWGFFTAGISEIPMKVQRDQCYALMRHKDDEIAIYRRLNSKAISDRDALSSKNPKLKQSIEEATRREKEHEKQIKELAERQEQLKQNQIEAEAKQRKAKEEKVKAEASAKLKQEQLQEKENAANKADQGYAKEEKEKTEAWKKQQQASKEKKMEVDKFRRYLEEKEKSPNMDVQ